MAMSDASSTPAEWTQLLFRRNSLGPRQSHPPVSSSSMFDPPPSSTAPAVLTPTSSSRTVISGAAASAQHVIEGRVSKPARRRTRASRRAPTTMLNTDTTNFRAMVQQFTGIPSGPYSTSSETMYRTSGAPPPAAPPAIINYSINLSEPLGRANQMSQLGHVQEQQFHGHQQHYQQVQFEQNGSGAGDDDAFLQGFGDHGGSNLDVSGGLFFHGLPNHQMMPRATSTNNRTDGYFFMTKQAEGLE